MSLFSIELGDNASPIVAGISKFVADVKAISGPGAAGGVTEGVQVLEAAIQDVVPFLKPSDAALAEIKAAPVKFGLALAVGVVNALGL